MLERLKTRREFQERMLKAAGVASAQVVCAEATWRAVCRMSLAPLTQDKLNTSPFWLPMDPAAEGLAAVTLTGPTLSSLLLMVRSKQYMGNALERPLARRLYDLLGAALDDVVLDGGAQRMPPVMLDHRVPV